jgi:hypothetical protein
MDPQNRAIDGGPQLGIAEIGLDLQQGRLGFMQLALQFEVLLLAMVQFIGGDGAINR